MTGFFIVTLTNAKNSSVVYNKKGAIHPDHPIYQLNNFN